jgi:hypothetical protein
MEDNDQHAGHDEDQPAQPNAVKRDRTTRPTRAASLPSMHDQHDSHGQHRNETVAGPASSLGLSQVAAGGLAAATSAVLGSYFGVFGTVGGAAAGSVATTVSTTIYHRSIERTHATVRARIDRSSTDQPPHDRRPPGRERYPRRLIITGLVATVVIFALGMAVVSGIELLKGGPLSGGHHGTSVGSVLNLNQGSGSERSNGSTDRHSSILPNQGPGGPASSNEPNEPQLPGNPGGLVPGQPKNGSLGNTQPTQPQLPANLGGVLQKQTPPSP